MLEVCIRGAFIHFNFYVSFIYLCFFACVGYYLHIGCVPNIGVARSQRNGKGVDIVYISEEIILLTWM